MKRPASQPLSQVELDALAVINPGVDVPAAERLWNMAVVANPKTRWAKGLLSAAPNGGDG